MFFVLMKRRPILVLQMADGGGSSGKLRALSSAALLDVNEANGGTATATLANPLRIVQREHDAITAFAVCQCKPGWMALATARELQEMDVSAVLQTNASWMHDSAELDIRLAHMPRCPFSALLSPTSSHTWRLVAATRCATMTTTCCSTAPTARISQPTS